ncbi:DEAD/DEAH box helicase [Pedobacter insulae]|uniref:Superfamily II DNA or RNA helicase, SNF2 family n=1 Tax=Pedobacter insulae TaxID=414048 RepID=A0A1I2YE35_9SPHI|nr:SNF2-related protein [Pedobacter insulae]SFH23835.1 Superfamily II DNA or RNA helicase, SNF2 family [Pedobacter insulae]
MKEIGDYEDGKFNYERLAPILKAVKAARLHLGHHQPTKMALIFSRHRYYRHLVIELASINTSLNGKLKNPLVFLDPSDLIWKTEKQDELKFYSGVTRFKNNYNEGFSESNLEALKAILLNPLKLDFYTHDEKASSTINAASVVLTQISVLKVNLELNVDERGDFFDISGLLHLDGKAIAMEDLKLCYHYFVEFKNRLYLIENPYFLNAIEFFKQNQNNLIITRSEYEDFQQNILTKLEEKIKINYAYLKQATKKQRIEQGFDLENEQIIYLSESEDFVLITPVMKYGNLEIPVISQKQIRSKDKKGQLFTVNRNEEQEIQFINTIAKMHPQFKEQMEEFSYQRHADCFYLHRKHFLQAEWFLEAFEVWRSRGIAILGFNELKENKLNQYKAEIAIHVISGIDWFETAIKVKFNKQEVSLKHLHKSIRNKSKFVQLDDGTSGILPDEWLEKFEHYFAAGEIIGDSLHTPNINYAKVEELYEEELLDLESRERLSLYKSKFSDFEKIEHIEVSKDLNATLRSYQQEGLNWLNFLDSFNFGGCLADDMGLGKTVQVLAFILSQRERVKHNTNLVVVPASLVFNWEQEIRKFAPSLKVLTVYGVARIKATNNFDQYEIVLTSYGTLLTDIKLLKNYRFNYIFLDESQLIKNPDSQRYKAVRLLSSRNKIVMTGTPIENNTFDLYGQFSFACPGLLGSREQFRQLYSVPIDQFKDGKRAEELHKRINPFLLRRTKEQVATELPDKTEMVIYCEMGEQQREIYESCRTEIRDYIMGTAEDELTKSSMHVLQGITKLRQICDSPTILSKEKYYGNASAKMDVLIEQIENKAPFHKILVFSQFVSMLDLVKAELVARDIPFNYLTGQTKDRAAVVNSFQDDESVRVLLISLKAGGVGLNLTQADYVYLVDPWWNPAVENQAIDRTYRIGQHKNVMAVRLICPDTIEEKIMLMQETKKGIARDLIKTETSIFKSLSKKDLLELI